MPSSDPALVSYVCREIMTGLKGWNLESKSMLDIGIGYGKYGFLAREYAGGFYPAANSKKPLKVDGIERYEPYVQAAHKLIYDNIYIGNAFEVIKTLGIYDLILCIDMLEHLPKDQGSSLLKDIKLHGRSALVITPRNPKPQDAVYENVYEKHISNWNASELAPFGTLRATKLKVHILEITQEVRID